MITLRPYQTEAIDQARRLVRGGARRILIVAPTGAGKTIVGASILHAAVAKGARTLFFAHRRELVHQSARKVRDMGIEPGLIMAGEKESDSLVQVASIQTLARRTIPDVRILMIDEAHRTMAKSYQKVIEANPDAVVIGLTATPERYDGKLLGDTYDEMVQVTTVPKLIEEGYLVQPRVFAPYVPDMHGVKQVAGDFNPKQLEEVMNTSQLVGDILRHWEKHAAGRPTAIFASGVAHSRDIAATFAARGHNIKHLDGTTDKGERDDIIAAMDEGDIDLVTNVGVLTEGWDCPRCSCAVMARPTTSVALYLQIAGRILRPFEGKKDAMILDHAGNTLRHGFVTDDFNWELRTADGGTKKKRKVNAVKHGKPLRICKECLAVFAASMPACPDCGTVVPVTTTTVKIEVDGELIEYEVDVDDHLRKRLLKASGKRMAYWVKLERERKERGYKPGWSKFQYRKRFGSFPTEGIMSARGATIGA